MLGRTDNANNVCRKLKFQEEKFYAKSSKKFKKDLLGDDEHHVLFNYHQLFVSIIRPRPLGTRQPCSYRKQIWQWSCIPLLNCRIFTIILFTYLRTEYISAKLPAYIITLYMVAQPAFPFAELARPWDVTNSPFPRPRSI